MTTNKLHSIIENTRDSSFVIGLNNMNETNKNDNNLEYIKSKLFKNGFTIGLLLKEYTEFQGLSLLFWNIFTCFLIVYIVLIQLYGTNSSIIRYHSIEAMTNYNDVSISSTKSIVEGVDLICNSIRYNIVYDTINNKLRLGTNSMAVGSYSLLLALSVSIDVPANHITADKYKLVDLSGCKDEGCEMFTSIVQNSDSPTYTNFFNLSDSEANQSIGASNGFIVTIFDTRDSNWTTNDTVNAINYMCDIAIPAMSPYSMKVDFMGLFSDIQDIDSQSIIVATAELSPVFGVKTNIAFDTTSAALIYYPNSPYYHAKKRLLIEIIVFIIGVIDFFYEFEDYLKTNYQSGSSRAYFSSGFNILNIFAIASLLIFVLVKWIVVGIINNNIRKHIGSTWSSYESLKKFNEGRNVPYFVQLQLDSCSLLVSCTYFQFFSIS